jgi:7-carboxy-7-deazaguanine synthase
MLQICEIFKSIQGESTFAGDIFAFVRLAGCNLQCSYCDTVYARDNGRPCTVDAVVEKVSGLDCERVEITGGEPLLQGEIPDLARKLLLRKMKVLVETNGTQDISVLPDGVVRIVDIKCPGSGHADSFRISNLENLRVTDQCKFVLTDRIDFDWASRWVAECRLPDRCTVIFSPASSSLHPRDLAEWIVQTNISVRLGLQLHKIIWGEHCRGV